MSLEEKKQLIGTMWRDWTIKEYIGSGSGGMTSVYNLERKQGDFVESNRVLKVVNILEENISLNEMSDTYRQDFQEKRRRLSEKAREEVVLMDKLRNCNNVVTYQDYEIKYEDTEEKSSSLLYIRMNKYSNLSNEVKKRNLSESEIIKLGIDICSALNVCEQFGIIHRDIKPENIFINEFNDYLLGDFGISTIAENGNLANTNVGTAPYAAPEQFRAGYDKTSGYDNRVDIYSLGLTLYYLANAGKLPFQQLGISIPEAIHKRLSGEELPHIRGINTELEKIILHASAFSKDERYSSAKEMMKDLELLKSRMQKESYSTEAALSVDKLEHNIQDVYETELALNIQNSENLYETEPALEVKENACENIVAVEKTTIDDGSKKKKQEEKDSISLAEEKNDDLIKEEYVDFKEMAMTAIKNNDKCVAQKALMELGNLSEWNCVYQIINEKYSTDSDISSDFDNAIYWLQYCIDNIKDSWIVSLAEYKLGDIYARGVGIKKNHKIAEKLFASSAAKGNPYAKKKFIAGRYIK